MATTPRKAALVSPMPSPERRQRAWAAFTSASSATAMTAAASVGTGTPAARLPSKGFSINGSSDAIPAPTTHAVGTSNRRKLDHPAPLAAVTINPSGAAEASRGGSLLPDGRSDATVDASSGSSAVALAPPPVSPSFGRVDELSVEGAVQHSGAGTINGGEEGVGTSLSVVGGQVGEGTPGRAGLLTRERSKGEVRRIIQSVVQAEANNAADVVIQPLRPPAPPYFINPDSTCKAVWDWTLVGFVMYGAVRCLPVPLSLQIAGLRCLPVRVPDFDPTDCGSLGFITAGVV